MAIADELIALLGFKIDNEEAARRYEDRLNKLTKSLGDFAATAGRFAGVAAGAMATGFGLLGKSVITTSAQFETFQATLETIEGSSEKAKASLDWISEFGKTTPYEVSQVTAAFVKLKAYGIDPIANDVLRVLGDTAAAMGKTLDQAVEAFADASTGEFERLKEFGIKASTQGDQVTFSWTKNGQEMTKTVKKNATEIRQFLLETMGDRFAGAMDRQSKTFRGITSNLADSWTDFQRRIGDAGFFANITSKLQSLLDLVNRLDKEGRLDEWATSISNALSSTADVLWAIGTRIAQNVAFLAENWEHLQGPMTVVAGLFALLVAKAFPLMTIFLGLVLVVDDFLAYLQGGESVIGDFIKWIQDLTGVSEGVAQALAGLAGTVLAGLGAAFLVAPGVVLRTFGMLLVRGIAALAPLLLSAFGGLFALLSNPIGWAIILAGVAAALVAYFWDDLVAAWEGMPDRVKQLFAELAQAIVTFNWGGVGIAIMTAIWDGMKVIGSQIADWFKSLVPDWASGFFDAPSGAGPGPRDQRGRLLKNYQDNSARSDPRAASESVLNDNRQDNRNYPMEVNTEIHQTITQATDAPGAAASATGSAVSKAVAGQRTQIEQEPAF